MKFIVDEMPKKGSECLFFKDGCCTIDEDEYCNRFNNDGEQYSYVDECGHLKEV